MAVHTCANCQYVGRYDFQAIREPGLEMSYHLVPWHFPLCYRGLALAVRLLLLKRWKLYPGNPIVEHHCALEVPMSGRCL